MIHYRVRQRINGRLDLFKVIDIHYLTNLIVHLPLRTLVIEVPKPLLFNETINKIQWFVRYEILHHLAHMIVQHIHFMFVFKCIQLLQLFFKLNKLFHFRLGVRNKRWNLAQKRLTNSLEITATLWLFVIFYSAQFKLHLLKSKCQLINFWFKIIVFLH